MRCECSATDCRPLPRNGSPLRGVCASIPSSWIKSAKVPKTLSPPPSGGLPGNPCGTNGALPRCGQGARWLGHSGQFPGRAAECRSNAASQPAIARWLGHSGAVRTGLSIPGSPRPRKPRVRRRTVRWTLTQQTDVCYNAPGARGHLKEGGTRASWNRSGTGTTGYGVVELAGSAPRLQEAGTVRTARDPLPQRLKSLYAGICEVIRDCQPDLVALRTSTPSTASRAQRC